jgi:hypothetical protein
MDPRVERLKTPEECRAFIENARARGLDDLVRQAHQRIVALRTEAYGPKSEIERQCAAAIYAYEEALSARNGKRVTASKTWQVAKQQGIFTAIDKAAGRAEDPEIYPALVALGLEAFAFENVVVQHPDEFGFEAVQQSRARVAKRNGDGNPYRAS